MSGAATREGPRREGRLLRSRGKVPTPKQNNKPIKQRRMHAITCTVLHTHTYIISAYAGLALVTLLGLEARDHLLATGETPSRPGETSTLSVPYRAHAHTILFDTTGTAPEHQKKRQRVGTLNSADSREKS